MPLGRSDTGLGSRRKHQAEKQSISDNPPPWSGRSHDSRSGSSPPRSGRQPDLARRGSKKIAKKTDASHGGRMDDLRSSVWVTFENPKSSVLATAINYLILVCIVVSSLCIHLESMPELNHYVPLWAGLEVLFVVVFSLEYLIRFWAAPMTSKAFFWEPYNFVDFLAVMPFYIVVACELLSFILGYELNVNVAFVRLLRLCRIFKMAKYSHPAQLLIRSMRRAYGELIFLLGFLACGLVFFGTLMYAVEQGQWRDDLQCYARLGEQSCSPFESIPATFYWGITTMTTVGYGDVLPTTKAGTFVACMTMFMGILVIALPVTMISNAFMDAHDEVSMAVKREHAEDGKHMMTPAEQELFAASSDFQDLLGRLNEGLNDIHVKGAELLMAQGKIASPEEALEHWNDRVLVASQVATRGLANLKAFAVILRPEHVC